MAKRKETTRTFPILSLSKSDIEYAGFDTTYLDIYDVSKIAARLTFDLINDYNKRLAEICEELSLTPKEDNNAS